MPAACNAIHQFSASSKLRSCLRAVAAVLLLSLVFWTAIYSTASDAAEFRGHAQPFVYSGADNPVSEVPFVDEQGTLRRLADYQGQVVLVNLWASWCSACIYEMPELNALQQALGDKGLKVLTLNQDLEDGKLAGQFLRSRGFEQLTGHLDPNFVFGYSFGQKLLPMTLLFDSEGRQIGHLVGPAEWNSAEAKALIEQYLPQ